MTLSRGTGSPSTTTRVLVLGLGASGVATARYLAARPEFVPVAADEADTPDLRKTAEELRGVGVNVELGASEAPPADVVVASPGIPPASTLMRSAARLGVPLISEVEFAFTRSEADWVAVTGTNGKTTVTDLIGHLLAASEVPARTVGNIGTPPIEVVDSCGPGTVMVAEVSSFQLAATRTFRPRASVLLNITPDHLDWHPDLDAYAEDKAKIFANQGPDDLAVIVIDDEGAARYVDPVSARGVPVCRVTIDGVPSAGAGLVDGLLTLDRPEGPLRLVHVEELRMRGAHNVLNALAAAAAAMKVGATLDGVREGLRTYVLGPHRIETVAKGGGVEYVDDSKATNPDAVVKALQSFADRHVVVLLGGKGKGTDFRPMAQAVAAGDSEAVLFGEAAEEIGRAFEGLSVALHRAGSLADAVRTAASLASSGDVVLLSPGCASFDEFRSYAHRGEVFARVARELAEETPHA